MFNFTDTKAICEEGAWVHLKNGGRLAYLEGEDGKEDKSKPVRIKLRGPDSETLQVATRKRAAKRIKDAGGNIDLGKMSQSAIEAMLEEAGDDTAAKWADATITWENMPGDMEFSPAEAEKLYTQYPAITRQLEDEAGDVDDFIELAGRS